MDFAEPDYKGAFYERSFVDFDQLLRLAALKINATSETQPCLIFSKKTNSTFFKMLRPKKFKKIVCDQDVSDI